MRLLKKKQVSIIIKILILVILLAQNRLWKSAKSVFSDKIEIKHNMTIDDSNRAIVNK